MNNKKPSIEEVRRYFKENGCELLSKEYRNGKTKLEYICTCGQERLITFEKFKAGQRCRECSYVKSANGKKIPYEEVKKCFEDNNCILLSSEYVNNTTQLDYQCECGNVSKIAFMHFKKGVRCKKCAGNEKYTINEVEKIFRDGGCELTSKKYVNNKRKLDYICLCGRPSRISLDSFQRGTRCSSCKGDLVGDLKRHTYEYVLSVFNYNDCKLVSEEYINTGEKLDYICICGNLHSIRFNDFQKGVRCQECRIQKMTNYDLTEDDRGRRRLIDGYKEWRDYAFERDNYTCLCCGARRNLNAHHKDAYHWNEERRLDNTNSATLCEDCHVLNKYSFHKVYGNRNNTEEQYNEWISKYKQIIIKMKERSA